MISSFDARLCEDSGRLLFLRPRYSLVGWNCGDLLAPIVSCLSFHGIHLSFGFQEQYVSEAMPSRPFKSSILDGLERNTQYSKARDVMTGVYNGSTTEGRLRKR